MKCVAFKFLRVVARTFWILPWDTSHTTFTALSYLELAVPLRKNKDTGTCQFIFYQKGRQNAEFFHMCDCSLNPPALKEMEWHVSHPIYIPGSERQYLLYFSINLVFRRTKILNESFPNIFKGIEHNFQYYVASFAWYF